MVKIINKAKLRLYNELTSAQIAARLIMPANYVRKMVSLPEATRDKGLGRARLLFKGDFSKYVAWLIEQDYARDERVIMTIAEETPEYRKLREKFPPILLEPPAEQSEPRREDDG